MGLKYFKATETGYTTMVYVRHFSEEEARNLFRLFLRVEPCPEKGPLSPISWWEGYWKFKGLPDDHAVTWQELEIATDFYRKSASYEDLVNRTNVSLPLSGKAKVV